jgi:hypothetical protein
VFIQTIDQGQRSGYAMSEAGSIPRSGFVLLRKKGEPRPVGHANLIAYLCMCFDARRPDLFVYEAPISVAAWHEMNKKAKFPTDPVGVESGFELTGVITGVCGRYGIRAEGVRRQTILRHMTGTHIHGGRAQGKKAVIAACIARGLVEAGCKDDDRCDAIAMHVYASEFFAKVSPSNFRLFGQK